jgi:hypothetical protein
MPQQADQDRSLFLETGDAAGHYKLLLTLVVVAAASAALQRRRFRVFLGLRLVRSWPAGVVSPASPVGAQLPRRATFISAAPGLSAWSPTAILPRLEPA